MYTRFARCSAHLERVPYETLDIVLGKPPGIDPLASARRILGGRGGYCYHLNGASRPFSRGWASMSRTSPECTVVACRSRPARTVTTSA